jgi:hypothetical protein
MSREDNRFVTIKKAAMKSDKGGNQVFDTAELYFYYPPFGKPTELICYVSLIIKLKQP